MFIDIKNKQLAIVTDFENIEKEERYIRNELFKMCNKYNIDRLFLTIHKLNRNYIENTFRYNYNNYAFLKAFEIIINQSLRDNDFKNIQKGIKYQCSSYNSKLFSIKLSESINNVFTNHKLISSDSNEGFVYKNGYKYLNDILILKVPIKKDRSKSSIHEYFIGLHLNSIRRYIPNFIYTYGYFNCKFDIDNYNKGIYKLCDSGEERVFTIYENVNGILLTDYLSLLSYNDIYKFISIITQVLLSIQIANEKINYIHRDLHSSNIMIRILPDTKVVKYEISESKTFYVLCDNIATIIDYGYNVIEKENNNFSIVYMADKDSDYEMIEWWSKVHKGNGIDIVKLVNSLIYYFDIKVISKLKDRTISPFGIIKECLKESFDNLNFGYIFNEKDNLYYGIPKRFDEKLLTLTSIEYLEEFYKCLLKRNIDFKNVVYDKKPDGYNLFNDYKQDEDIEKDILKELDNINGISPRVDSGNRCDEYTWKMNDIWYREGGLGNIKECIDIKNIGKGTEKIMVFSIPKDYDFYQGDKKIIEKNYDYTDSKNRKEYKLFFSLDICNYFSDNSKSGKYGGITSYKLDDKMIYNCFDLSNKDNYEFIMKSKKFNLEYKNNFRKFYIAINDGYIIDDTMDSDFIYKKEYDIINELFENLLNVYDIHIIYIPMKIQNKKNISNCFVINNRLLEKIPKKIIYRNISNYYDFQYFDDTRLYGNIGNYIKDLKKYDFSFSLDGSSSMSSPQNIKPYNNGVWSSLYLQDMIKMSIKNKITLERSSLEPSESLNKTIIELLNEIDKKYSILMIISSFLHTIGYGGTINYNRIVTRDIYIQNLERYLLQKEDYIYMYNDSTGESELYIMNIESMLNELNITNKSDINLIYFIILSTPLTIDLLKQEIEIWETKSQEEYKNRIKYYIKQIIEILAKLKIKFNKSELKNLFTKFIKISIIVSISIIYGINQYIDKDLDVKYKDIDSHSHNMLLRINTYLEDFPFIQNIYGNIDTYDITKIELNLDKNIKNILKEIDEIIV